MPCKNARTYVQYTEEKGQDLIVKGKGSKSPSSNSNSSAKSLHSTPPGNKYSILSQELASSDSETSENPHQIPIPSLSSTPSSSKNSKPEEREIQALPSAEKTVQKSPSKKAKSATPNTKTPAINSKATTVKTANQNLPPKKTSPTTQKPALKNTPPKTAAQNTPPKKIVDAAKKGTGKKKDEKQKGAAAVGNKQKDE